MERRAEALTSRRRNPPVANSTLAVAPAPRAGQAGSEARPQRRAVRGGQRIARRRHRRPRPLRPRPCAVTAALQTRTPSPYLEVNIGGGRARRRGRSAFGPVPRRCPRPARRTPQHADPARLSRRPPRRGAHRRGGASDPGDDLAHRRRADRRLALLQMREPPARRRLQVPRRLQRHRGAARGPASTGRRGLLVGQPRPGDGAGGPAAGGTGHHRDAAGRPRRQGGGDARLRRRGRALRPLHGRPRGDRAQPRRGRTAWR